MITNHAPASLERHPLRVANRTTTLHVGRPPGGSTTDAGVLVLHPWWGVNDDVLGFAGRLAGAGFTVAAPDIFEGRVARTIEEAEELSSAVDEDFGDAAVLAAVDELGRVIGDPGARLGVVGFSFGAGWALWLPAQRPEVVATVVYYGTMEGPSLSRARTPVLGHFAESDVYEPPESVAAVEQTLRTAGRDVTMHTYPATGHWFAEPSQAAYVEAAAELAFERTVEFLRRVLAAG